MNKKENVAVTGVISAEQRARISQNFRAAKALLARKRTRESDHLSLKNVDAEGSANKRFPLSDISSNTSGSLQNFKLTDSECISNLCFKDSSVFKVNNSYSGEYIAIPAKKGTVLDAFRTPIRKLECVPVNRIESRDGILTNLISKKMVLPDENGKVIDSFKTPVRRRDCSGSLCSMDMNVSRVESSNCVPANLCAKNRTVLTENGKAFDFLIPPIRQLECTMGVAGNKIESSDGVLADNGTVLNLIETPSKQLDRIGSSDGCLMEWKGGVPVGEDFGVNSYITPVRQQECFSLGESLTSCSDLDEVLDESILQEIDALCENKLDPEVVAGRQSSQEIETLCLNKPELEVVARRESSQLMDALCENMPEPDVVAGWESLIGNLQMKNQYAEMNREECNTIVGPVVSEDILKTARNLDSGNVQNCDEEGSRTYEATHIGGMPEAYAKYMQSLNDKQREAACSDISIPLMIVAGPGSGKTSTMVGRVLMLLNEGIGPSHILAMTFTTAAASEMRDRIAAVAGKEIAKELMISTFHSFCLQLCRSHSEKLERTMDFLIYGQGQQRRAIIEAVRLLEAGKNGENNDFSKLDVECNGINSPQYFKDKAKKWLKFVNQAKASGKNPKDCRKMGDEATILQNYSNILKSCNALDYHDLISCSVKLLTDFPEVMKECQEAWKAIVIDEFQDTSAMQYGFLQTLASHKRITIVGDEDQSIFSFNGADAFGFNSFRKDFSMHKEVRLNKNYRSTRCIIEAASFLIRNNAKRSQSKDVLTDNSSGSKITIKECCNEDAQCAFVVDKILEISSSDASSLKGSFGSVAVLYRRQVSGIFFQTAFRDRKIPFNIHGVAFYRKKVVRAIVSMLKTTLLGCDDNSFRRVFKALLLFEKEEKKKVIEHIDKISTVRKCSFISAAGDIFRAKISGTFKRSQLTQGRKVLLTLDMISKLVHREQSITAVITSAANIIPQKYLLEQRAVQDVDGGKLLNEGYDLRSVLQYLLDDVSEFLKTQQIMTEGKTDNIAEENGCVNILKGFIDYISERERENFRSRRHDNENSVTLTTIHQSKGLEWDTVFIVKVNESEIPLLHEYNGVAKESASSLEEERRLLYVAMTRARKKLFILYVLMDSNWQILQPSRFLDEIPKYLQEVQDEPNSSILQTKHTELPTDTVNVTNGITTKTESTEADMVLDESTNVLLNEVPKESTELIQACNGNSFLKRFSTEARTVVSHLFHQWAKKSAFQEPKRLIDKVGFVIDERLRIRKSTHKDVLRELKSCLGTDEALQFAEYVLKWEQIPADKRAYIMREKQEYFQKLRIENAMGSSAPTSKQIGFLQNLGCTVVPTSRLHASRLIEQYKSL